MGCGPSRQPSTLHIVCSVTASNSRYTSRCRQQHPPAGNPEHINYRDSGIGGPFSCAVESHYSRLMMVRSGVYVLYLVPRCMQPEGPWQRLAAALADSSAFLTPP